MIDWEIDCGTFLRLTSATLGEYGLYFIEPAGVRALQSEDDIAAASNILGTEEAAVMLEFVRTARLALPTTASKLIAWIDEQGGEFQLPSWFRAAARSEAKDAARTLLELAKENREMASRSGRAFVAFDDAWALSRSEIASEVQAINSLLGQVCLAESVSGPIRRHDDIAIEIETAINNLGGGLDSEKVMAELQSYAGRAGSCVIEVGAGLVVWRRASGGKEKLAMDALKQRLKRWKVRQAGR